MNMRTIEEMRASLNEADKNLQPAAKLEVYKNVQNEAKETAKALSTSQEAEATVFDNEAAKLKPEKVETWDSRLTEMLAGPEENPSGVYETEADKREKQLKRQTEHIADSKQIAVLNYFSKVMVSRITAEADSGDSFLESIKEMASHENKQVRNAFIDNYAEILKIGKGFEDFNKVAFEVKRQYKSAKESLKSPEAVAYEKALEDAAEKQAGLIAKYHPHKMNLKDFTTKLDLDLHWMDLEQDKS
jgi:hypothetical protein